MTHRARYRHELSRQSRLPGGSRRRAKRLIEYRVRDKTRAGPDRRLIANRLTDRTVVVGESHGRVCVTNARHSERLLRLRTVNATRRSNSTHPGRGAGNRVGRKTHVRTA